MTRDERIAIARIFYDLIMADRIVDTGEMEYWDKVCEKYQFTSEIRVAASSVSFSEALKTICSSRTPKIKADLLSSCREMTVSDGFCAHSEALIIIALIIMLDEDSGFFGEVYSIPRANFNVDVSTALYIENFYDSETNEAIQENYRAIFREFQLAGFHFVYIPRIIDHYRETAPPLLKSILSFLSPSTSNEGLSNIYRSLMEMNTARFCQDILCNKCGITELRQTVPSLLIKIGTSFVGDEAYANYLRIEVDNEILHTVQNLMDRFCDMLSSDMFVVHTSEERDNQFHFHGFYKQLLNIFLIKKNIRSKVLINPYQSKISFPDIDASADMSRRDRAFYALLLCYGEDGINFSRPRNKNDIAAYNKRSEHIQKQYALIYEMFGGNGEDTPDLFASRSVFRTNINNAVSSLAGLYNPDDYCVSSTRTNYTVHLEQTKVFVMERNEGIMEEVDLKNSNLYKRIFKIE